MSALVQQNEDTMPDDTTPEDAPIPLDIAVAGSEAITHYRVQVAALVALGDSAEEANAAVLDQWESIHAPHLRAMSTLSAEESISMTPLDTLRLRLATVQRNIPLFDEHHHFMGSIGSGTHLSAHLTHASTHSTATSHTVSQGATKQAASTQPRHVTLPAHTKITNAEQSITTDTLVPIKLGLDHVHDPLAPPDAHFLTALYGKAQLPQALDRFNHAELKRTTRQLGIAAGKNKEQTIERIYAHVTGEHITIQREGAVPPKASPSAPKDLRVAKLQLRALMAEAAHKAEQQAHAATKQQLAQLQREHAKLQAENARLTATKTATKAAKTTPPEPESLFAFKNLVARPNLPIGGPINMYAQTVETNVLHQQYGTKQLRLALTMYLTPRLRLTAKELGLPSAKRSRADLIESIAQHVTARDGYIDGPEAAIQSTSAPTKSFQTHLESQLLTLTDASDPLEAQRTFGGGDRLYQVLSQEPEGALELMLQHANMPPGPAPRGHTANVLARNIVQRLEATKTVQQETKITPIARIAGREINPAAKLDPVFIRTLYGDAQFEAALSRFNHNKLKEAFTWPAFADLKPGKTVAATIQILMQRARDLPLMPHTPLVPTSA